MVHFMLHFLKWRCIHVIQQMTKAKLEASKGLISLLPLLWPEAPCYDLTFQRQIQGCLVVTSQPLQAPLFSPSRLMSSAGSCPEPQSWAQGANKDRHGEREAVHDTSSNIKEHKLQYMKKKKNGSRYFCDISHKPNNISSWNTQDHLSRVI